MTKIPALTVSGASVAAMPPTSTPNPRYLRALGSDVAAGLALVVHDVVVTGALPRSEAEAAVRIRAADYFESLEHDGVEPDAGDVAVWTAEAVQGDLIEGLGCSPRLATWPVCPDHRHHPLWLRSADRGTGHEQEPVDDPVWTCPDHEPRRGRPGAAVTVCSAAAKIWP